MPTSIALKSKLLKPCNKLLQLLRFRPKRPIFKSSFRFKKIHPRKRTRSLFKFLRRSMQSSKESDNVGQVPSMTEPGQGCFLFPSPVTPAYVKLGRSMGRMEDQERHVDDAEDACRSFESYLLEMIIEEGKVGDLVDVEELLYCWKNLKCPVFHDLVCRFYGELCRDLFSGEQDDEQEEEMHGSK